MKNLTLFLVCITLSMAMTALAFGAFAACSTCAQEGDWSQTATSFISGTPLSDVPQEYGPKAVRKTESQFENASKAAPDAPSSGTNAPVTATADTSASKLAITLASINASPSSVNSGSPVKITAIFSVSGQGIANNASVDDGTLLTASAAIKDSTGKDVGNVNLIKSSLNEYSGFWSAQVPADVYNVSIFASSLQASGTFSDALQINVVASGSTSANASAV